MMLSLSVQLRRAAYVMFKDGWQSKTLATEAADTIDRMASAIANGNKETRRLNDEIDRLTRELAEAREARQIEIGDGVLIYREGSLSITVCAATATIYNIDSGIPAAKVPLDYEAVHEAIAARALKDKP